MQVLETKEHTWNFIDGVLHQCNRSLHSPNVARSLGTGHHVDTIDRYDQGIRIDFVSQLSIGKFRSQHPNLDLMSDGLGGGALFRRLQIDRRKVDDIDRS